MRRSQSLRRLSTKRKFPSGAAAWGSAAAQASSGAERFANSCVGGDDLQSLPSFACFASAALLHSPVSR
ncbi:MAG: hypothetical protein ACLQSX_09815, partial [Smithella sp.]